MLHWRRLGTVCLLATLLALGGLMLVSVVPTSAATIGELTLTDCRTLVVKGTTEVNTSFVRVQVVLASNLGILVTQKVVRTRPRAGASYVARLSLRKAHLEAGTHVIISVGEWDGTQYLVAANITGADCDAGKVITPMPDMTLSPDEITRTPAAGMTPTPTGSL